MEEEINIIEKTIQQCKGKGIYGRYIKRLIDVLASVLVLLLFGWLYLLLMLIVRVKMGSPVFYSSERIGKDEKPYMNYKFRSMTNETDENGVLLPAPQRLTKFGRLLRSTSLDEIPAVLNVLKGELSIVGPRPLPGKYLPYYYEKERLRHAVRPGLTGWAQVNGRNAISWDEKLQYDVEYVEKLSFLLDFKIVLMTVGKVLKRSDIIQDDQQTASLHIVRANLTEKDNVE